MRSKPEQKNSPDWRHTIYRFCDQAVQKYGLKPQEIAIYTALFSKVKSDGLVKMGNTELMAKSGLTSRESFRKSRDRLLETGIIKIVKKGTVKKECTTYRVKLMERPPKKRQNQAD